MIWLTWRQLRTQTMAVFLAVSVFVFAVVLVSTGSRLHHLARANANLFDLLTGPDHNLFWAGIVVLAVGPAVIGAFWGAPMVARELEAGTHRLVWNQSVTRTRWLATKLAVTTLAAAAAVGALSLVITWWSAPIDGARSSTYGSLPARLTPVSFAMRGIAPIGYAVFAIALGVALGIVLRRSLPAIAVTLVVVVFVQIGMPLWVRPHMITPVTEEVTFTKATLDFISLDDSGRPLRISVNTGHPGDWILSNETVDESGHTAALPAWLGDCLPVPPAPGTAARAKAPDLTTCFDRLTAEGYRQHVVYQPASRFWALQWTETGLYLAVSGLLIWFCFWRIRRRLG